MQSYSPFLFFIFLAFSVQAQLNLEKIEQNSLHFSWTGHEVVGLQYGLSPDLELGYSEDLILEGLQPASFYYVKAIAKNIDNKNVYPTSLFTTASLSSGDIHVYFNNSVDNNASALANAQHVPDLTDTLVAYINRAQSSMDICNYNTGSARVVAAINAAAQRSVQIRYIASYTELGNNDQLANLSSSIPLLQRPNDGEVMHNKFIVFDAASAALAKVLTGSTNHTDNSLADDYNNMLIVEDQSLALAYKTEFEEMWGSTGSLPNAANAKFGAAKTDNTPHQFSIGGRAVQLYFSPSDGTTAHIETALLSANTDLSFAMLTFINNDLGDAVINRKNAGVNCRGIIENVLYFGSEYNSLQNAGVNVLSHFTTPQLLHHKYCTVDANNSSSDPLVITGSHNWTNSAEDDYDENTLIIHDATIAAIYYEEFSARFNELTLGNAAIFNNENLLIYPNPATTHFYIETAEEIENLSLYNVLGQATTLSFTQNSGNSLVYLNNQSSGLYNLLLHYKSGKKTAVKFLIQN